VRRVGHADAAVHDQHLNPDAVPFRERAKNLVGGRAGADEEKLEIGIGAAGLQSAVNHDGGGVVPAEEVDGDPSSARPVGPSLGSGQTRA